MRKLLKNVFIFGAGCLTGIGIFAGSYIKMMNDGEVIYEDDNIKVTVEDEPFSNIGNCKFAMVENK